MKSLLIVLFLLSVHAVAMDNKSTICQYADQQRKIDLVYPEKTELPCEVQYTKSSGMEVLWRATSETGFCESKYQAFVEKQKGWGWRCEALTGKPAEHSDESPVTDDSADDAEMEEDSTDEDDTEDDEPEEDEPSAQIR